MAQKQPENKFSSIIHYLCRDSNSNSLVYPNDLDTNYNTLGSFFIVGEKDSIPNSSYEIKVVENNDMYELEISIIKGNNNFFSVYYKKFGRFIFYSENITSHLWKLNSPNLRIETNLFALRRLRAWNVGKFEKVCKYNDFYFVGFANLNE